MTVKSRVAVVRDLPAGSCVSYGPHRHPGPGTPAWRVCPSAMATASPGCCPTGMDLIVHGVPCPIVGRICMDMCMIDVTDVPDVKAGDEVLVYGPGQAERAAQTMGTIVYELLCDLTGRVPGSMWTGQRHKSKYPSPSMCIG